MPETATTPFSARLHRAVNLAARAHQQQMRKGSPTPYIAHPVGVAMLLQQYGFPEDWVIAGLLHDTLEDTSLPLSTIRREFGDEVAGIVHGCTEPGHDHKPWRERKQHSIGYLATAPYPVKVVTCADKLHNLQSILIDLANDGETIWEKFRHGREQQAWYYRSLAHSLRANLAPRQQHRIFADYLQTVARVFD